MKRLLVAAILGGAVCNGQSATPQGVQVFAGGHIAEVYRISLKRDALLLESILDAIKTRKIQDGQVMITAGSVQECTYHYVASTAPKAQDEYRFVLGLLVF